MGKFLVAQVHRRPLAALLLICLLAWLPGFFTLPPLDRDESRFAQATKQMLETGDFININLGDGPRYEKPAGIYWLQAASTAVLGTGPRNQIWTYRLPSLVGALTAVAATFFLVRAFAGVEAAFAAGLLLGMSVLLMSEAKIAKTDAFLLGCIVVAQAVIMRVYLSVRTPDSVRPAHSKPRHARLGRVRRRHSRERPGDRARLRGHDHRRLALRPRLALAVEAACAPGLRAHAADGGALGHRDRDRLRRPILSTIAGQGFCREADRRTGDAWRPHRLLRAAHAPDLLARQPRAAARHRARHRAPPRARDTLSAAVGGHGLADVRDRPHQAAALHPACIPCARRAVRPMADRRFDHALAHPAHRRLRLAGASL